MISKKFGFSVVIKGKGMGGEKEVLLPHPLCLNKTLMKRGRNKILAYVIK